MESSVEIQDNAQEPQAKTKQIEKTYKKDKIKNKDKKQLVREMKQQREGRCKYVHVVKARYCGQPLHQDSQVYCRFHIIEEQMLKSDYKPGEDPIIACPYEPKLFIPTSRMEDHLKRCPKVKHQTEQLGKPWFQKGINFQNKDVIQSKAQVDQQEEQKNLENDSIIPKKFKIKDIDEKIRDSIIDKINKVYAKLKAETEQKENINQLFQVDEVVDRFEKFANEMILQGKQKELSEFYKHSNQQSKIIDIMCQQKLILTKEEQENEDEILYLEFGAGRAGLSSFVARKLIELENCDKNLFLVVDRDTRRFKLDKEFNKLFRMKREKMDIADFDLKTFIEQKMMQQEKPQQLESLNLKDHDKKELSLNPNTKVISIAKHLCGGATDLSLTSLSLQDLSIVKGLCIATCCHHCCDTATYVNLEYLKQLGFTDEKEYVLLPRISSWGISQNLEKKRIGLKVKKILEYGRCLFIEKNLGMKAFAYQYCDPVTESPENTLLVAIKS